MVSQDRICLFKWLVFSFDILYLIVSVAIAIFTLYLRFEFFSSSFMLADQQLDKYYVAITILITGSLLGVLAGIAGVFGVFLRKIAILAPCLAMVIAFLLVQLCGGCYGYYYRYTIHDDLHNGIFLKHLVESDYGENTVKTKAMDYMQWQLECCGGESYMDYKRSIWYQKMQPRPAHLVVPAPCCEGYERHRDLKQYPCQVFLSNVVGSRPDIKNSNPKLHGQGCGPAVIKYIEKYYIPLTALATSFVIYQVIFVILISMFIHFLRQRYAEDEGFEMSRSFEKSSWKGGSANW